MINRDIFKNLAKKKAFRKFSPILETLEGIFLGSAFTTDGPPHIRDRIDMKRYMLMVILALIPSAAAAVYFFGWAALKIIITSYVVGGIVEVAFTVIRKKQIEEGFLVTGLIFPLVLPPTVPLWVVASGVAFGVFFGKEMFGGTGRNIFNPALVGRLFITLAFPQIMSASWRAPFADVITSATPLALYKSAGEITQVRDLILGLSAGSMGELFRIGIIAGGLFLIVTRISDWRVPLCYLAAVFVFAWIGNAAAADIFAPPVFQLLSGGLLFGAMFMATDPVTSPDTRAGKIIFGIGCGITTVLIRSFSGYTEGVMFSIVLMNAFTPLIDHLVLGIKYKAITAVEK